MLAQAFFTDHTAACKEDDFQETVTTYGDAGKFGIRGKSSLLHMDVFDLLRSQRLGFELRDQLK